MKPGASTAWTLLGGALVLASLGVAATGLAGGWRGLLPSAQALDGVLAWRPDRLVSEPWRLWTAALVHLSPLHLLANGAGGFLVVVLGRAARLPASAAVAWMLAWPLTHLGLLAAPALMAYGGLSGVLHAGVACAAVHLVALPADERVRSRRRAGWAILVVLLLKVVLEQPWLGGGGARQVEGWDIPVASAAHASGLLAGLASSVAVLAIARALRRR